MTEPKSMIFPGWHADPRLPIDRPFTVREAHQAGVDGNGLARLVRQGVLRRVFRGVYVDAALPDSIHERARALALVVPEAAVITDATAAWLYGVDVFPTSSYFGPMPRLHVFRLPDHTRVRRGGVQGGRRTLQKADLLSIGDVVVTTPLRTACDLGRILRREQALAAMDALLHLGDFTQTDLCAQVERFHGRRGVVQLRELAPLADGRAESVRESALRLLWIDAGLPKPDLQIPVAYAIGREPFRLDLGDTKVKYAAEFDGHDWHSTPEREARDAWRRDLIRKDGWTIDVFHDADLHGWDGMARLRDGHRRATERTQRRADGWDDAEEALRVFRRPRYAEDFLAPDDVDGITSDFPAEDLTSDDLSSDDLGMYGMGWRSRDDLDLGIVPISRHAAQMRD